MSKEEPTITKRQLQDVLNRRVQLSDIDRRILMALAFPPPEPRTFYIALTKLGEPCDSSDVPFYVSSCNTLIKVIEVIE